MFNRSIGTYGEELSLEFLKSKNYTILNVNFRCKLGEVDIICKNKNTLIFIEVKSRYSSKYGTGSLSVNKSKQKKIINTANYYITSKRLINFFVRFDVIEVFLNIKNNIYDINHIIDAFRL